LRRTRGATLALPAALLLTASCAGRCGARGGLPPERPPTVTGPDGQKYHLLDRGAYKAYYDRWGRLQRLEYDSNGDGRPDQIAHHEGQKMPRTIEVDQDFDGRTDRWEDYDPAGNLAKVGTSRRGKGPDVWTSADAQGQVVRREYDEDGDGKPERWERLQGGLVTRVEIDSDRDGRPDRWQGWRAGRLEDEELDTDHDGRPDRRIRYADGKVVGLDPVAPR
jgi:hypothetical protein